MLLCTALTQTLGEVTCGLIMPATPPIISQRFYVFIGFKKEALLDWWSFTKLAFAGVCQVAIEISTWEVGILIAGEILEKMFQKNAGP